MTDRDAELRRLALEVAFDDNPDPAFVLDPEGKVAAGNRALLERAGVPADRLREAYRGPTIHPDDRSRVRGEFTAAMAGQARRFECRGVRSDGSAFHVEVSFSPIRGDGEVLGVLGVAHDIDELAEMRSSLDRSEARLTTALDGIGDAIVFVDDDWRMTFLNARATVLLGRGRSELVGTVLWDLDLPDPEGADMLRESMRTRLPLSRRRFAEDLGRWVEVSSFPAGDLLGIQVRDVTEIEEARRSTQDDARLLHARSMLMDESDDAIVMQGLGGVIEYANASAAAMFGVDGPDLLIGRRLADLLGIDPRVAADLDRTLGRDRIWRGDLDIAPRPGVRLITDNYWTVVDGPDGSPDAVFCIIADVTERRREAESLVHAQRLESIGILASGIAHDLGNVLTPLMLATEILTEGETDGRRRGVLEGMRGAIERGGDMIRQVLTFVRGAEGEHGIVEVAELARGFADFCRNVLPKDIDLRVEAGEGFFVVGDSTELLQVLVNLATNARDAMPDGGRLVLTTSGDEKTVTIEVADDGLGMSADTVARVFEPFYTTKEAGRGTGLGLWVSQSIAQAHGGTLTVTTELGAGTVFRLELPRAPAPARTDEERTTAGRLDGLRVLVVDDEDDIVELATLVIARAGGTAFGATDALDAQAVLDESAVDVVVTDLMMPGTPGREFLGWLGVNRSAIPVVAMSGVPEQGARATRFANVRVALDKPFTSERLIDAIRAARGDRA